MTGLIFYFTGTGNSLSAAAYLAGRLGASIVNIAALKENHLPPPEADLIGFVFPVYHGSLPLIAARFLDTLTLSPSTYIFGVCTYGDHPGLFMEYLRDRVAARGGRLSAGFGLHMPYNYVTPPAGGKKFFDSFSLREIDDSTRDLLIQKADERLEEIAACVERRASGILETDSELITRLVDALHLHDSLGKTTWMKIAGIHEPVDGSFNEARLQMDKAFSVDESCRGCGTRARVCPVHDIDMVNDRPTWQHHCEQCFACLQWCPNQAIQFRENTRGQARYHHPRGTIKDMLQQ